MPLLRLFETADAMLDGAGERAFNVSEQLGFQEIFGKGVAVHCDHGLLRAGARQVNRAGDHFLAGPGFAGDQDRRAAAAHQTNYLDGRA